MMHGQTQIKTKIQVRKQYIYRRWKNKDIQQVKEAKVMFDK
jgi:hypothetical protein